MLNEQDWKDIVSWKKDAENIRKDLVDAKKANVPNVDLLLERCDGCIQRLNDIQAVKPKKK
jgi:hypothetical protein